MNSTNFTPLLPPDISRLLAMISDFYIHEHITFDAQASENALKTIIDHPEYGRVFLIRSEDVLCGYMVLTFGYSLEFHGRFALLDELYIQENYTGQGMGRRAIEFAENLCHKEGIKALRLEVETENQRALKLYEGSGFVAHNRYYMTKWLSAETAKGADF